MEESMLIGGLLVVGALVAVGFAIHAFLKGQKIGQVQEASPESVTTGMVAIDGRVEAEGPLLKAPISEEECVAFDYRIQEQRRQRRRNRGSSKKSRNQRTKRRWETVESGCRGSRFRVVGQQGAVVVDGQAADIDIKDTKLSRRSRGGGLDLDSDGGGIGGALAGMANAATSRPRRYREKRLEVGETVYVIGEASRRGETVEIGMPSEGNLFVISDRDASSLARSSYITAAILTVVAVALIGVGVAVML